MVNADELIKFYSPKTLSLNQLLFVIHPNHFVEVLVTNEKKQMRTVLSLSELLSTMLNIIKDTNDADEESD